MGLRGAGRLQIHEVRGNAFDEITVVVDEEEGGFKFQDDFLYLLAADDVEVVEGFVP
tara:strand:- start:648 stop:818 length:171 start_codon:yes stop_codon:yes gene_type:complete